MATVSALRELAQLYRKLRVQVSTNWLHCSAKNRQILRQLPTQLMWDGKRRPVSQDHNQPLYKTANCVPEQAAIFLRGDGWRLFSLLCPLCRYHSTIMMAITVRKHGLLSWARVQHCETVRNTNGAYRPSVFYTSASRPDRGSELKSLLTTWTWLFG